MREQCEASIKDGVTIVDVAVADFTALFEQSIEAVTLLQEDPNLQSLNMEARELQQLYDEARATMCIVTISLWLAKLHEAKKLLEQVEVSQRKEAILKARLGSWLDEAYVISTTIEEKLACLQRTQHKIKEDSVRLETEQLVE